MAFSLTDEERGVLLFTARESIASRLEKRPPGQPPGYSADTCPTLTASCGAFVSLHLKDGPEKRHLRGCIGLMSAHSPLLETVREMACAAAFEDPRFPPLSRSEFPKLEIEISVLSPMEACEDPGKVVPGTHGVHLSLHGRSGVFLPQVAPEQGWDRISLLEQLGLKAGLYPEAYRDKDTRLSVFTAIVFSE